MKMSIKRKLAAMLSAMMLLTAAAPAVFAEEATAVEAEQTGGEALVTLITPPQKTEETPTPTPEETTTPTPKPVAAAGASVSAREDVVTVEITGEAGLAIYCDLSGDTRTDLLAGDTVTFTGLDAGEYDLEVDYHDVQKGVSAFRTSVTVEGKKVEEEPQEVVTTEPFPAQDSEGSDSDEQEEKTVAAPGASVSVSGDSVSITIIGEAGLRMYVDATIGWDDEVYAGETVTFSGLEAGKSYDLEVDYYDVQEGVTAYRTSFTAPAGEGEESTPPEQGETTPPAGSETTPPAAEEITPPPAEDEPEAVKQFELALSAEGGVITAKISGASEREVDVELILGDKTIGMQALIGSGSVTFGKQGDGTYTVRAAYVTPADGVTAVEKTIEIKDTGSSGSAPAEKKPTVTKIGVKVVAGKDYIEIKVTDADPWQLYVAVGKDYKVTSLGKTVRFEGLAAGDYEIEVDYVEPVAGVTPLRTSVTIAKAQYKPLEYGDTGDDVEEMTERLRDLGYMEDDVRRYSSAVREAVKTFQKINGLKADGIAGVQTLELLYSSKAIPYGASGEYLTLMRGDKGLSAIYTLQRRLRDLGYYTIAVDGIYGSGTERAVRHFQRINGLDKTGVADNATQQLLYSSAAKPADSASADDYKVLSRSSKYHTAVVPLQRRLKALGYAVGSVDGYFGSQTYRAVREFQRRNGLSKTGVADEITQRVLFSSSAVPASGSSSSSSSSSSSYRLLYWGCKGEDVKTLQKTLLAKGYKQVRVADGVYGQWTYDAVRAFQKDRGLSVDGIAGKDTQNALYGTKY